MRRGTEIKEAGLKDVAERIYRQFRDMSVVETLVNRIKKYLKTQNNSDDLTPSDTAQIYRYDEFGAKTNLTKRRSLDLDWTSHAEYRSDLRDVDPMMVNHEVAERLREHLLENGPDAKKVKMKLPGVGTAVVDYDLKSTPAKAEIVTVWASERQRRAGSKLRMETQIKNTMVQSRKMEREKKKYVDEVGSWLRRMVGQGSNGEAIWDKVVKEIPGRNTGVVAKQRKMKWVKYAKEDPAIMEFCEYIGGEERMNGPALYILRDIVAGDKLFRDGKESAESMAGSRFVETKREEKSDIFEEGGYEEGFMDFLPPFVSFDLGPTREVLSIVETFGREKKTWAVMSKKLAFIAASFNEIVKSVKKDLKSNNEEIRLCALMTAITIETGLRPGNVGNMANVVDPDTGEKVEVETFGVTTIQAGHVRFIRDNFAELRFVGKKGTEQIATLSDKDILVELKKILDNTDLSGNTPMLFVTKDGRHVDYGKMKKYVSSKWGDITPTDFRKLRASRAFHEALKARTIELRDTLRKAVAEGKKDLRAMVVSGIMNVLEASANEAKTILSHDEWKTTVQSYIDPRIVVNFLNNGGMDDALDEIIINGKNVRVVFDFEEFLKKARVA